MKQRIKKASKVTTTLIIVFSILLVTLLSLTMAYFTDSKSYTGTLNFGNVTLKVTDKNNAEMKDGDTIVFDITRTGEVTQKLMPGDTIGINFNVSLQGGDNPSEPAYYLVSISDTEGVLDEATYYHDGTNVVKNTDSAKSVGELIVGQTHKFNISKQVPTNETRRGVKTTVSVKVYAVQKTNLEKYNATDTSKSAYHILMDKLTPKKQYTREDNYIYFGSYPQSYAGTDATALGITSTTTDENGYYTGSNGTKYAKITAAPYGANYTYSDANSTKVTAGEAYFKVEPLKWRILKENADGTALIVCDNAITAMAYQPNYKQDGSDYYVTTDSTKTTILTDSAGNKIYANNYKYSALRAYLTGDFCTKTFNAGEKSIIKLTEVDNSASTTSSNTNKNACENTNDYVFALSYQDMKNNYPEFNLSFKNTDYALATGVQTSSNYVDAKLNDCGSALVRSPQQTSLFVSAFIKMGGTNYSFNVNTPYGAVVPAMNIVL